MDQLLQYLAPINGHSNMQLSQMNPDVTPTPGTPNSTSSEDSPPSSSQTSPSYDTEEEQHQMMNLLYLQQVIDS